MLEILERQVFKYVFTCDNCHSKLAAYEDDIKYYVYHRYDGSSDSVYYITCPVCHSDHEIDSTWCTFPKKVTDMAQEKYKASKT